MKNAKLASSTILETLIALTILLLVFGITTSVFVQVGLNSNSIKLIKASAVLNVHINLTNENGTYFDETIVDSEFKIVKTVTAFRESSNLYVLRYRVYDVKEKLLVEQNQLVPNEKNQ